MKRRQADGAKLRRPLKRTKIVDGFYSSAVLYCKFLVLWGVIILADFILEFRFEFLWPFWMLLRSVYDSFKYQGLAFSMFFVCIALTSDMICFFFIPVQWVFFAASTYVWVQYIWYTDKGICLPTMILCSVFIYMEAGVRLRDLRHMPAHLDLCRPFAAHCIGYPVVTLGFGFKSYISYRMRKRRQQEVARENSFYMQLLQQALPPHEDNQLQLGLKEGEKGAVLVLEKMPEPLISEKQHMNGSALHLHVSKSNSNHNKKTDTKNVQSGDKILSSSHHSHVLHNHSNHSNSSSSVTAATATNFKDNISPDSSGSNDNKSQTSQNHSNVTTVPNHHHHNKEKDLNSKMYNQNNSSAQNKHAQSNGVAAHVVCNDKATATTVSATSNLLSSVNSSSEKIIGNSNEHERNSPCVTTTTFDKDCEKSSSDANHSENDTEKCTKASSKVSVKPEKKESHASQREERRKNKNRDKDVNKERESTSENTKQDHRESENNNRGVASAADRALRAALASERQARAEITQLKQQNEQLNAKINSLNATRQADRAALTIAERRLNDERRARQAVDARLRSMHKSGECVWEACRQRRSTLEQQISNMRDEMQQMREHNQNMTQSLQAAEQQVSTLEARSRDSGADTWHKVKSLRERIVHLEHSLSAETRVKLDLFSAVGEAKRELDIREEFIKSQNKEIEDLKGKMVQMVAVSPGLNDSFSPGPSVGASKLRLTDGSGIACYPSHLAHHSVIGNSLANVHAIGNNINVNMNNNMSNLDPNATAYTPKGTMMPCSPAAEA